MQKCWNNHRICIIWTHCLFIYILLDKIIEVALDEILVEDFETMEEVKHIDQISI
jgi:hypothetical protein